MDNLTKLRYWTFKILPLVYDDSLSYYEVLTKVTAKINELIDSNNSMPQAITTEVKKQLSSDELATQIMNGLVHAIATDEGTNTFTKDAKSGGELIFLNGTLYKVTAVMSAGTNYIIGTNIVPVNISEELRDIKETYLSSNNEHWNGRSTHYYSAGEYLFWKDILYITTKDINVNDILYADSDNQNLKQVTLASEITIIQKQIYKNDNDIDNLQKNLAQESSRATNRENFIDERISNIVAQSGNDNTEIVDARTGYDGTTYTTLGTAIRTQVNNLNSYILGELNNNLLLNYKNYIDNKYINISDGGIETNTEYCYTGGKIPVKPNSTYQLTYNYMSFAAFYKLDGSFISGKIFQIPQTAPQTEKFLTPKECYYIAISINKDDKNKAKIINISPVEEKNSNILIVNKYGNGDFTTINDALNKAYSIESKENPITILIYPGVYEEVLFIQGKHYISLIGTNRNDCIIKDETALYNNAPLRIQGQCYVANLSFISTANKYTSSTGTGKEAWITDVLNGVKNPEWLNTIGSYAVHCDDETNEENTTSRFENCYMYSETFPAFGAGMQLNNTIELVDCYLLTNIDNRVYDNDKGNGQGTLLVHGKFPDSQVDEPNQKLFVKDCYIEGINSKCVNMYPSANAPKASITYINNTFMNNHTTNIDDLISFNFDTKYIEKCSNGNNLEFFNRKLLDS